MQTTRLRYALYVRRNQQRLFQGVPFTVSLREDNSPEEVIRLNSRSWFCKVTGSERPSDL